LGAAADYLGPIAALVLTVLAAVVPSETLKGCWGPTWRAAFIAVGIIAAAGSAFSIHAANQREANMRAWSTGEDNYCYLKADLAAASTPSDPVPWWLVNGGAVPIEKVATWVARYKPNLTRFDKEYREFLNQPRGYRVCGLSPVWSGVGLGRGHYQIDISTPDKHFVEVLQIAEINGQLEQSIVVTEEDEKMRFTTDGFVK
jgi:hypothetical protein